MTNYQKNYVFLNSCKHSDTCAQFVNDSHASYVHTSQLCFQWIYQYINTQEELKLQKATKLLSGYC